MDWADFELSIDEWHVIFNNMETPIEIGMFANNIDKIMVLLNGIFKGESMKKNCGTCRFNYNDDDSVAYCKDRREELGVSIDVLCGIHNPHNELPAWEPIPKKKDMVNKPPHYNKYKTEVIDIIKACLTEEAYQGYLLGNMIKYRMRAGFKEDRDEDLDKSNWYQDKIS